MPAVEIPSVAITEERGDEELSDGQQMLIPRQMLGELKQATVAQAADLFIGPQGLSVWWPQLDDGLYLPDFLEHRWGKVWNGVAA